MEKLFQLYRKGNIIKYAYLFIYLWVNLTAVVVCWYVFIEGSNKNTNLNMLDLVVTAP